MDTAQAIILMTIVNTIITGLVGGIVIYTVQRKIDATIQKSLFEHQTKFTRNYNKKVEVLENLYKRVSAFNDSFRNLIFQSFDFDNELRINTNVLIKCEYLIPLIDEASEYYRENLFDLPEGIVDFVGEITIAMRAIPAVLEMFDFVDAEGSKKRAQSINIYLNQLRSMDVSFRPLDLENPDYITLLDDMQHLISRNTRLLENLYRLETGEL